MRSIVLNKADNVKFQDLFNIIPKNYIEKFIYVYKFFIINGLINVNKLDRHGIKQIGFNTIK